MTFNAMTEHYEEITVCGKPALFTSIRIKRDTVPDGLYTYDFINKVCIYFSKVDCTLKYFCCFFTSFIHSLL